MPIEIKELLIKAVVSNPAKTATTPQPTTTDINKLKREMVKECVQEVLEKLKEKSER